MKNPVTRFRQEYIQEQRKSRQQAFLDSNRAAINFSAQAIKSAILLNGMGAVAVLYSPQIRLAVLNCTLFLFSMGALCAVIANGIAYLAQYQIMESWRHELYISPRPSPDETKRFNAIIRKRNSCGRFWKICTAVFLIISWSAFFFGTLDGYMQLQKSSHSEINQPATRVQPSHTTPAIQPGKQG